MRNAFATSCICTVWHSSGRYLCRFSSKELTWTAATVFDIVVEDTVILELKCVEHILPVHEAQLLTYHKLTGKRVGLIVNLYLASLARSGVVRTIF
jgi:GxxExxY protein